MAINTYTNFLDAIEGCEALNQYPAVRIDVELSETKIFECIESNGGGAYLTEAFDAGRIAKLKAYISDDAQAVDKVAYDNFCTLTSNIVGAFWRYDATNDVCADENTAFEVVSTGKEDDKFNMSTGSDFVFYNFKDKVNYNPNQGLFTVYYDNQSMGVIYGNKSEDEIQQSLSEYFCESTTEIAKPHFFIGELQENGDFKIKKNQPRTCNEFNPDSHCFIRFHCETMHHLVDAIQHCTSIKPGKDQSKLPMKPLVDPAKSTDDDLSFKCVEDDYDTADAYLEVALNAEKIELMLTNTNENFVAMDNFCVMTSELVDTVHRFDPASKLCFNTSPTSEGELPKVIDTGEGATFELDGFYKFESFKDPDSEPEIVYYSHKSMKPIYGGMDENGIIGNLSPILCEENSVLEATIYKGQTTDEGTYTSAIADPTACEEIDVNDMCYSTYVCVEGSVKTTPEPTDNNVKSLISSFLMISSLSILLL